MEVGLEVEEPCGLGGQEEECVHCIRAPSHTQWVLLEVGSSGRAGGAQLFLCVVSGPLTPPSSAACRPSSTSCSAALTGNYSPTADRGLIWGAEEWCFRALPPAPALHLGRLICLTLLISCPAVLSRAQCETRSLIPWLPCHSPVSGKRGACRGMVGMLLWAPGLRFLHPVTVLSVTSLALCGSGLPARRFRILLAWRRGLGLEVSVKHLV